MPGNTSFGDPPPPLVNMPPARLIAARYEPTQDPQFTLLPNIRILSDQHRDGAAPAVARYRYEFSNIDDPAYPDRWEQVFPYDATGRYVVGVDERIVCYVVLADGSFAAVADGYAGAPQLSTTDGKEEVTFECQDAVTREWDNPIAGAIYRDGTDTDEEPNNTDPDPNLSRDIQTNRPVRFNPDGRPNASPKDVDTPNLEEEGDVNAHPVFFDEKIVRDPDVRRHWTLGMAARYLMAVGKKGTTDSVVKLPDFTLVDQYLTSIVPAQPGGVIDPTNPDSYKNEPILVPDLDVTGQAWPDALEKLLTPHGFGVRFELGQLEKDNKGLQPPTHHLVIYRKDDAKYFVEIGQQPPGEWVDWNKANAPILHMQRDSASIVNEYYADTQLRRYEIDVVLAPGFIPQVGDEDKSDAEKRDKFNNQDTNAVFSQDDNSTRYRLYHAGEAGDFWYHLDDEALRYEALDLSPVFQSGEEDRADVRRYARVRRPPLQELFTLDDKKKPRRAQLWISKDYAGTTKYDKDTPQLWDRKDTKSHWQQCMQEWRLLDDRLGIAITAIDPRAWQFAHAQKPIPGGPKQPFPDGKIDAIWSVSAPNDAHPRFWLRLTCVIEDDRDMEIVAKKRPFSPTRFAIRRRDDSRERFKYRVVDTSSHYSPAGERKVVEDDKADAQAHVDARRRAHELGKYAGSFTIPWITLSYELGDKVWVVRGRNVLLNMLAGPGQGEKPVFPSIVGVDRVYEPSQTTTVHLSDLRAEAALAANFNFEATRQRAKAAAGGAGVVGGQAPVPDKPLAAQGGGGVKVHRRGAVDPKTIAGDL